MPNTAFAQLFEHCQQAQLDIGLPPKIVGTSQNNAAIRQYLENLNIAINQKMLTHGVKAMSHIENLLAIRTLAIDGILIEMFDFYQFPKDFALFAVGGYGRGELSPASDIDILLIGETIACAKDNIEKFVADLWDIGITPAFSVRSLDETRTAASEQTIATAMLEARILAGNWDLANFPYQVVKSVWTIQDFYAAKMAEAKERYLAYNATAYNLEPNIKNAPGGLRDLHMIGWLWRFYFGKTGMAELVASGFINADECESLLAGQRFLWCIRHHLHTLTARGEDRLLFDYQKSIAQHFGYYASSDTITHHEITEALEAMMRLYYRHVMRISALSEVLCEYFYEKYLANAVQTTAIDDDFCLVKTSVGQNQPNTPKAVKIAIAHADTFTKNPANLLKIFLIMGQQGISQITASTLRAMYLASALVDEKYRSIDEHRRLFLANLQENNYLFHRLRLMKRFGILGNYLPAFGKIMGLMQYDLFHRYTVDAHTLLLVRILHRFADKNQQDKYDLVSEVYQKIARKDILVIAAIFHDIAKGRGGDHSTLGAVDAYQFCITHGMSEADSQLVQWLVLEHLTMSLTAQKQDISDPEVIAKFAEFTGSITRLNHLYVLTVADMNATNNQLWNNWRASLLKQLYVSVHRVHSLGVHVTDKDVVIASRKQKAQELLPMIDKHRLNALWDSFGEEFFLKQKHRDIAWQSAQLLHAKHKLEQNQPIIALRPHSDVSLRGVQLLVCAPDQDNLFATTVCFLDKMGFSVLDATIISATIDGINIAVDSYVLLDQQAETARAMADDTCPQIDDKRTEQIIDGLTQKLKTGELCQPNKIFKANKLKHFTVPTQVHFSKATTLANLGHHKMYLVTKDNPSLLAKIGMIFSQQNIQVHGARITTLGERAEDTFYLSGRHGKPLDEMQLDKLKDTIIKTLG
ncbi:[protein-PII] uridylyltransferase [Moraxella sp. ZJ142]|uniref:[protein-PII] uridylyltransferase n=1 Tax=Moraxella marmotae TaxID=3344520 RepID=UPI0035D48C1A